MKISYSGEELLDRILEDQTQKLINKIPVDCPEFTRDDYMTMLDTLILLDEGEITAKKAKLQLLTLASEMDQLKANVTERLGNLITKLPSERIVEKNKIGEVDMQTRYHDALLSALFADSERNVLLRWPNKADEAAPDIRPDAIISTLIQSKFGRHLGYGEVKSGDDSTSTQLLCVDTLTLAVLSRNTCLQNDHPILTFQHDRGW